MDPRSELPDWERLLAAERHVPHVAARGRHFAELLARGLLGGDE